MDYDERPIATNLRPYIIRNHFELLRVAEVNNYGAFMDWGLEKHLLVPFSEQRTKMQEGQWYVVFCYLDEVSFRLVASNKLDKFVNNDELTVQNLDEVDIIVTRRTDLGWEVILNNKHKGLVYSNEVFKPIAIGDRMLGYVKNIRPDHKIDISLNPIGYSNLEPVAQKIYEKLVAEGGFLKLHDKSDPEEIKNILHISKKVFKKGIGTLYKERKIEIKNDGIYLN